MKPKIILASKSIIRNKLLNNTGINYINIASDYDESDLQNAYLSMDLRLELIKELVYRLAFEKAMSVSKNYKNDLIIGCDQVLFFNKKIYLKPKNVEEASNQIKELSGQYHKLITSTVCIRNLEEVWYNISIQEMKMRQLNDRYIQNYITDMKENIFSIIGGYEIEGKGINLFEKIGNDLFSIQGISIIELLDFLRRGGYIE
ncbi:MAG: Maf family nucleotide pyrophosphatase [Hyphomicrobiales bacterium]|jgi:septum formation protein|nr:Maf family nucleotide pyrophosphatase [Hyphomicrobiales bacterium]|tara:strand:- start:435 stop:1040 length:606 start_codon:yes stop_codon:yes gene_type:complete